MEHTNYTNLRKNLTSYLDFVSENEIPLIITRGNEEPVVMVSFREYNSWKETEYLTSTEANRKYLKEALEEVKNGKLTEVKLVNGILQEVN